MNDVFNDNVIRYIRRAYTPPNKYTTSVEDRATSELAGKYAKPRIECDEVSISPLGRELQKGRSLKDIDTSDSKSAAREEKIARLRQMVAKGEYHVSNEALAEKMIAHYLG